MVCVGRKPLWVHNASYFNFYKIKKMLFLHAFSILAPLVDKGRGGSPPHPLGRRVRESLGAWTALACSQVTGAGLSLAGAAAMGR